VSKQHHHRPGPPQPSPQQAIAECEKVIQQLEAKRQGLATKAAEHARVRERCSYQAHVMGDAEASKELAEARAQALDAERELSEVDSAISTARGKLVQAQAAAQRDQRRQQIRAQRERSKQYRELGGYLDLHLDHVRRGLQALAENAVCVGRSHAHVATTSRCLQVVLFDTIFRDSFGVPDYPTRQSFATFKRVIDAWCDSMDANLARELEALDGEQKNEAA
jgi:hypothetical protein